MKKTVHIKTIPVQGKQYMVQFESDFQLDSKLALL